MIFKTKVFYSLVVISLLTVIVGQSSANCRKTSLNIETLTEKIICLKGNTTEQSKISEIKFEKIQNVIYEIFEETENKILLKNKFFCFKLFEMKNGILASLGNECFASPIIDLFIPPPNFSLV